MKDNALTRQEQYELAQRWQKLPEYTRRSLLAEASKLPNDGSQQRHLYENTAKATPAIAQLAIPGL